MKAFQVEKKSGWKVGWINSQLLFNVPSLLHPSSSPSAEKEWKSIKMASMSKWPINVQLYAIVFPIVLLLAYFSDTFYSLASKIGLVYSLPVLALIISNIFRSKLLPKRYVSPSKKAVLITGCDSGFGNLVASRLDAYGFKVFAGVLFPDSSGVHELQRKSSGNLEIIKLDVTRIEDVDAAVSRIASSGYELWALINNAGIASYFPAEFGVDTEEVEKMFAVNVYGLVRYENNLLINKMINNIPRRMTKKCLPLLKQSKGSRIVNLSSMLGRLSFNGLSVYCMSKFAVRSFSDSIRREMYQFGMKVVTIEPLMYSTNIMNVDNIMGSIDKVFDRTGKEVVQSYGEHFRERFKKRALQSLKTSRPQVHEVIDAIEDGVTNTDPEIYYRCCGPFDRVLLWISGMLNDQSLDVMLTGRMFSLMLWFFKSRRSIDLS